MSVIKSMKTPIQRDEVREMLIASAEYNIVAQSQEICQLPNSRKRRGSLCGLSLEEKIMRKKLKNREAAQNSRDKKKAYVENLESAMTVLQEENLKLSKKVLKLIEENKTLKERNEKIEKELLEIRATKEKENSSGQDCFEISVTNGNERSAEPIPQQKGLIPLIALNQTFLILCLMMTNSIGSMKLVKNLTSLNSQSLLTPCQRKLWNWRQKTKKLKWWGPMQKSWNPIGKIVLLIVQ